MLQTIKKSKTEMPSDWELVNFGDVIEFAQLGCVTRTRNNINKILLIKMGNLTFGGFNFNKLEYIDKNQIQNHESLLLEEGDFLFNTRNSEDLVGKCAVWRKEFPKAIFDNNILRIRFNQNKIFTADYVSYLFNSHYGRKKLEGFIKRTTSVAAIYYKDLKHFKIPLPPLHEQRKIASILSKVDELIQKTDEIIETNRRLKRGLVQRLLARGIGHTMFKSVTLGLKSVTLSIPTDWSVVNLDEVIELKDTPHYTSEYFSSGIPVIRTSDCQYSGEINYTKTKFTSEGEYEKRKRIIDPEIGDVLYTREAPPGIASIVDRKKISIGQRIVLLRPKRETLIGEFLVLFLNSRFGLLQSNAKIVKTTVEHVNIEDIREFQILLPSLQEQKLIIIKYKNIGNKILNLSNSFGCLLNLKKALMQQLLTGKIRVKV